MALKYFPYKSIDIINIAASPDDRSLISAMAVALDAL